MPIAKREELFVMKVLIYLVLLNASLALASWGGSAWMARTNGPEAYKAGALATLVVGTSASLALLLAFVQSRAASRTATAVEKSKAGNKAVSGVLLGMLIRMGVPMAAVVLMMKSKSPLEEAGFSGLMVLNYLVALPIETMMSLQFLQASQQTPVEPAKDS